MEWKPSSSAVSGVSVSVSVMMIIMDVLRLQWARAAVASCAGSRASFRCKNDGAWIAARPAFNGRSNQA